jgi:hypothetical protein
MDALRRSIEESEGRAKPAKSAKRGAQEAPVKKRGRKVG